VENEDGQHGDDSQPVDVVLALFDGTHGIASWNGSILSGSCTKMLSAYF
jgi:hypothetical protein